MWNGVALQQISCHVTKLVRTGVQAHAYVLFAFPSSPLKFTVCAVRQMLLLSSFLKVKLTQRM